MLLETEAWPKDVFDEVYKCMYLVIQTCLYICACVCVSFCYLCIYTNPSAVILARAMLLETEAWPKDAFDEVWVNKNVYLSIYVSIYI